MNVSQLSASLANALFGVSTGSAATASAADSLTKFKALQVSGAQDKGIAQERKDPVTIQALKQFEMAVAKAKDVKTALQDPRVLAVLLPALGLADQASYPGLVQKALTSDPKDTKGLLASLDSRFKTAATTLDLKNKGLAGLQDPKILKTLEDGYVQYQYQHGLDDTYPGMSDVLYFLKNAGNQKSVYDILGNSVLRKVVTGALGLPDTIAIQSVETQARAVTTRMKLDDLKDTKKVQALAQRYLMAQAIANSSGTTGTLLSVYG